VPTSPFEAKGQRGMPSAGIALSIKTDSPFVPVSHRALVVRTGTRNAYFDRNEGGAMKPKLGTFVIALLAGSFATAAWAQEIAVHYEVTAMEI
jgi:hypothetical protein